MKDLKVHLVQFNIKWQKPAENRDQIDKLLSGLGKSDLIVLPEMFTTGFTMETDKVAESPEGETIEWMRKLSVSKRSAVTGSLIVKEKGHYFNRLYWVQPDGNYQTYDKRHLFRMAGEDEHFKDGNKRIFPVLNGWRICPLICYDLRFPVWSRNQNTYDLLIYVANWPEARRDAWMTLSKARAIENLTPVISVNRVGSDGKHIEYSGDSAVYNAKGEIIAEAKTKKEEVVSATIKAADYRAFRDKFPAHLDADHFSIQL